MKQKNQETSQENGQAKIERMKTIGKWVYRVVVGLKTLSWLYGWVGISVIPYFHSLF
ncbi:hypothetical protein [Bacillus sp. NMTD17]|uniref:hypothetical protein n=1 Tax=Bacillus sp. NMTD17 TaxID=2108547 RepID=UPI0015E5C101|nr:hypothetical protein [Bacillus sp. NMTD17]